MEEHEVVVGAASALNGSTTRASALIAKLVLFAQKGNSFRIIEIMATCIWSSLCVSGHRPKPTLTFFAAFVPPFAPPLLVGGPAPVGLARAV